MKETDQGAYAQMHEVGYEVEIACEFIQLQIWKTQRTLHPHIHCNLSSCEDDLTLVNSQTYVGYHQMHDALGHEVPDALVDDGHVGLHQITDGLHLPLELWVHGEVLSRTGALTTLHLGEHKHKEPIISAWCPHTWTQT